ncbi:hypothetical protein NW754_006406 [Fusarium falciforme]|uniref:Uncharacterized protein n=1 Tax=Fusarium falciforme TaxID=195108 RepID=A0A9W8V8D5_9HYPO|nr:hypothetical protein NW754_006406 [Fusarium falciforme]KAJ4197912.1 hypothetical protein NW755_000606 [Fusarium falciforme]KAJ4262238.1 hypothetical protein NW757_000499 [Fusarium falciforme]
MRSLGQGLWSLLAYTIGICNANDSKYQHHDWLTRDLARIIWVQNPELASRPSSGASPCWPSSQLAPQRESPEISSRELQSGGDRHQDLNSSLLSEFQAHVHVRFQVERDRAAKTPKWRLHFTCIGSPPSTPPCSFAAPQAPYHRVLIGRDTHAHLLQT